MGSAVTLLVQVYISTSSIIITSEEKRSSEVSASTPPSLLSGWDGALHRIHGLLGKVHTAKQVLDYVYQHLRVLLTEVLASVYCGIACLHDELEPLPVALGNEALTFESYCALREGELFPDEIARYPGQERAGAMYHQREALYLHGPPHLCPYGADFLRKG
jgi:hypothetical protein